MAWPCHPGCGRQARLETHPAFVDQLLQRRKHWNGSTREKDAESWEDDAVTLIYEAAIKDFDRQFPGCDEYIRWFLGYVGLMTITGGGDWIPTRRLLNLAAECRMRERDKRERANRLA
jgi:hypothetical protein